jgi:hypothetical protein
MDDVRTILERMTLAINNHEIRPVSDHVSSRSLRKVDELDEVAVGSSVYCRVSPDDTYLSKVTVTELVVDKGNRQPTISVKWERNEQEGTTKWSDIYSGESCTVDTMIKDITALARSRGVRNLVHADRLPIIAEYAKEFAKHYTTAIRTAADELRELMRTSVDLAFTAGVRESAKHAAGKLRRLVADEEAGARVDEAIAALEQYNSDPVMLYSPNEHYLNSLIQQMVAADEHMASDTAGARHIWHNVRAYIKVQRKFVSELATKELLRTLVLAVEQRVRVITQEGLSELVCAITVPPGSARELEKLNVRRSVLEQALSVLCPLL